MIKRLEHTKVLSLVDDGALYQYCRLFAETEALCDRQAEIEVSIGLLQENLSKVEGDAMVALFEEIGKMRQQQSGLDTKIRQGHMAQRVYLVEFGLTPLSRNRVTASTPEQPKSTSVADRYLSAIPGGRRPS